MAAPRCREKCARVAQLQWRRWCSSRPRNSRDNSTCFVWTPLSSFAQRQHFCSADFPIFHRFPRSVESRDTYFANKRHCLSRSPEILHMHFGTLKRLCTSNCPITLLSQWTGPFVRKPPGNPVPEGPMFARW
uniref:(northern house mosquito) hypothetical protein n=1 Tax=Culex pipiens TaxID=7175 RepID=A0A8D8BIA4_CULPI